MQRQLAGYHAGWDIVTDLISLKVDGSAKSERQKSYSPCLHFEA